MPMAIFLGVEISMPRLLSDENRSITRGVSTITKNGLTACHISGAMVSVFTKSRAKSDSEVPFWWNENQKKITMPSTAKRAYIRCLISRAMARRSSAV